MERPYRLRLAGIGVAVAFGGVAIAQPSDVLTGAAALGDWTTDAPGVRRLIAPDDLPRPFTTGSGVNAPRIRPWPAGATPVVPDGFSVELFAADLNTPRTIRVAPNGDVFVAESGADRVIVFRPDGPLPYEPTVFADAFIYPYGIAFYPPGPEPEWVYVGQEDRIVRFPYRNGDLTARGDREVVVGGVPAGGHATRDIAFSPDGRTLYLAVGSASNAAEREAGRGFRDYTALEDAYGVGAMWGSELGRAAVVAFDPEGSSFRPFANGLRNCAGLTVQPTSGEVWCVTNERDSLGDNLPPDYVTRVGEGDFFGWPWFYIGANEDPRHAGARPDLADKVRVPDVLLQSHSAPLGIAFYDGVAFPEPYRGDAFVTLHGSWNRSERTGYKVVRIPMEDGAPTGEYEDFMVGFIMSDQTVLGRPVGVAVDSDGALLVSEDGNGTIWRVGPVAGFGLGPRLPAPPGYERTGHDPSRPPAAGIDGR